MNIYPHEHLYNYSIQDGLISPKGPENMYYDKVQRDILCPL